VKLHGLDELSASTGASPSFAEAASTSSFICFRSCSETSSRVPLFFANPLWDPPAAGDTLSTLCSLLSSPCLPFAPGEEAPPALSNARSHPGV